jgi:hypothetical protein
MNNGCDGMDAQVTEDEPCEQCGLCCRIFGPAITPTVANVYIWIEQGRTDILRWYVAFLNDSTAVPCAGLPAEELGNVVSVEMRFRDTSAASVFCSYNEMLMTCLRNVQTPAKR